MRADNKRTIVYSSTRMRNVCEQWLNNHAYANRRSASAEAESVLTNAILPADPLWHPVALCVLDGTYDISQALSFIIHNIKIDEDSGGNRGNDMQFVIRTMISWSMHRGWNYPAESEEYDRTWIADYTDSLADAIFPEIGDSWKSNRCSKSFYIHDLAEEHRRTTVSPINFYEIILDNWNNLDINHHYAAYRYLSRLINLTDWGEWTIERQLQLEVLLKNISREEQNGRNQDTAWFGGMHNT